LAEIGQQVTCGPALSLKRRYQALIMEAKTFAISAGTSFGFCRLSLVALFGL